KPRAPISCSIPLYGFQNGLSTGAKRRIASRRSAKSAYAWEDTFGTSAFRWQSQCFKAPTAILMVPVVRAAVFKLAACQSPLALPKTRRLTQFSGGFDLFAASVARIVGKRNVLHFDDFHG